MDIKGKVHCLFEQSGTFKNEFRKLGYEAIDYDIQNEFNQTDNVCNIFQHIEKAYNDEPSLFDDIKPDDLIMAFFPCVHFCGVSQIHFSYTAKNYTHMQPRQIFDHIIDKNRNRAIYFELLNKLFAVCTFRNLRLIFENPYQGQTLLRVFLKQPDIIDNNRMDRGDFMIKPTAYWFWNCKPTRGFTYQNNKKRIKPNNLPKARQPGLCSMERSMISSDYARNFICDFILGKSQPSVFPTLFD